MFSLKAKVAIITGSDRGIGKGIATIFAKAGANVVIASVNTQRCAETCQEIKKFGVDALALHCDVSNERDVESLVSKTVKKFGKLDIFVNNAGVLLEKSLEEVTEKELDWLLSINLKGVFYGTKHAAKQMKKQGRGGSIVNIASIAALVGYPGLTAYCASKGGVAAFTRAAAMELAPSKIRVNSICPGLVETPMTKDALANEKMREENLNSIPIHIIGQPEDIGYGALYLASDEARYVTGTSLVIDGGSSVKDG
ncbi:MAG: SDR family NAD(P)-dependent oxidoreductase [Candidatus Micrarchaeota archaeon]|nr:SDR family NAD(P)-dependent oxidoreductase [Candidatus Micrarchaeota archaeon]